MKLYADYTYYTSDFCGDNMDEYEFEKLSVKAQRLVDYYTQNRITDVTVNVKNAVCAVIEILHKYNTVAEAVPVGVKSEKIDDVDVTYESVNNYTSQKQVDKLVYTAIYRALSGTGLLYRGG